MAIPGVKVPTDDIANALKRNRGVIAYAAAELGCNRNTIYERVHSEPHLKEIIDAERKLLDADNAMDDVNIAQKAREALHDLLDKRDITATIFALKSKGGFVQQSDYRGDIIVECVKQPYRRLTESVEIAHTDTAQV